MYGSGTHYHWISFWYYKKAKAEYYKKAKMEYYKKAKAEYYKKAKAEYYKKAKAEYYKKVKAELQQYKLFPIVLHTEYSKPLCHSSKQKET